MKSLRGFGPYVSMRNARSTFWLPSVAAVAGFGQDPSGDQYLPPTDTPADPNLTNPILPTGPGGTQDLSYLYDPTPITAPAAANVPSGSTVTTATASTSTASPWSSIGNTFSNIFGNLAQNVLPGAVNKALGIPAVSGTTGRPPVGTGATIGAGMGAGSGALILGAVVIGALILMNKKR